MLLTCQTSRVNGTAIGLFSSSIKKCPRHLIDRRPLTEGVNLATAGWSQGQGGQAETIESNVRWLRQPRRLEPPLPSTRSLTPVMKITDPLPLDQIAYRSAEAKNQPKTSAARSTRGRQPGKQRTSLAYHSNLSIAGIDFHHVLPPQALIGTRIPCSGRPELSSPDPLFFPSSGRNECSLLHCRHFDVCFNFDGSTRIGLSVYRRRSVAASCEDDEPSTHLLREPVTVAVATRVPAVQNGS
jgi:hypothetical protein